MDFWPHVDRFLPKAIADAGAERRQLGRLTTLFALSLIAMCPVYVAIFWAIGAPKLAGYVTIAGVIAGLALVALRVTASIPIAVHLVLTALWGVLVANGMNTKGHESPALVWFTLMPAFGMLLVGARTALAWTAIAVLTVVAFVARAFFVPWEGILSPTFQLYYWLSSPLTIIPLHLGLVALFNAARARMLREVEAARELATEAHRQARVVLDAVNQGLLVVDRDACIEGEASAATVRWFGAPPLRQKLWTWVSHFDASAGLWLEMSWDQLIDGVMPTEVVLDQLRREFSHAGRTYQLEVRLIDDGGPSPWTKALVVTTDVTEARAAARADLANRELLSVLGHVRRDRQGFLRFLDEHKRLLDSVTTPGLSGTDTFRALHTLKGNASLYGLTELAAHCHELESRIQEDHRALTSDEAQRLELLHRTVLMRLDTVIGRTDTTSVSTAELGELVNAIAREDPHPALARVVRRWAWTSVGAQLEQFGEQASALAARLGKNPVTVHLDGGELFAAPQALTEFWSTLSHVVRNAVDHGLEAPNVRRQLGKGDGTISISAALEGAQLVVRVADDGGGINWDGLREKARSAGLAHESRADLEQALWADGISTAGEVSDISGRGVGMAATLAAVTRLGGTAALHSQPGRGTTFTFAMPAGSNFECLSAPPRAERMSG
jgi:signal transduction histidine kinase